MSKDNLVFALAGMVLGIIVGVVIINSTTNRASAPPLPSQQAVQQAQQEQAPQAEQQQNGQLPEGHPPVNQEALKKQIADQENILKNDPENQHAKVALGGLNFDLKNYQEAANWYEKALEKDPKNVDVNTDLGTSYLWMGDYQKAIEHYNKSLEIDPKHLQTLMNLGIARMSSGDRAGAAEAWEKVVTLYPNNPEAPMLRDAIKRLRAPKQPG
jgi:tetratricopeptide (TPR) repeat protein